MWEALALALLCLLSMVAGLFLGWTARDRAAVRGGDAPLPFVEPPLQEPIELELFRTRPEEAEE